MPEPTDLTGPRPDGREPARPANAVAPGRYATAPDAASATSMAMTDPALEEEADVEAAPSRRLGILGWLSIGWLVTIVGTALLAPILPFHDPSESFRGVSRQPPIGVLDIVDGVADWGHPLGTDGNGRDMMSRIVFGARASLLVAVGSISIGILVGGFLGLVAGYFRGFIDTVVSLFFNVFLSIPPLVLAMALIAVFAAADVNTTSQQRTNTIIVALAITAVPTLGRITRGSTISWSERDFVKAAQVAGARPRRIMFREVLPNVLPALFSIALLSVAVVIVIESALSILGIGVQGVPSWGNIIAQGQDDLRRAPHIVFVPSFVIFFTVLSLNYLGDVIRARFDVRESIL